MVLFLILFTYSAYLTARGMINAASANQEGWPDDR
jgi:hypothetical protein